MGALVCTVCLHVHVFVSIGDFARVRVSARVWPLAALCVNPSAFTSPVCQVTLKQQPERPSVQEGGGGLGERVSE